MEWREDAGYGSSRLLIDLAHSCTCVAGHGSMHGCLRQLRAVDTSASAGVFILQFGSSNWPGCCHWDWQALHGPYATEPVLVHRVRFWRMPSPRL